MTINWQTWLIAQPTQTKTARQTMLGAPAEAPLAPWLIFTGLILLAIVLLLYFGHIQRMIMGDHTHISPAIALLYAVASVHCFCRTVAVTREIDAASSLTRLESGVAEADGAPGQIAAHIRNLARKARSQGKGRLDQTLLLRALASRLRGSNGFGAFMSDMMIKLGLLGTVIGFIMMLAPIAGLDVENQGAVKSSMSLMSDGMAVAMYTTLAGLTGALLVKIQYSALDRATAKLFTFAVELTEVHVVPVLERQMEAE